MEKILKLFSYSMILAIMINMMSPLMIYAAVAPQPVRDYVDNKSNVSQVEMQKQMAVEQKKAQEEMYKAMGLSTAEIEYIEKNDFEAIKTRLDKYVTYDKDGYAKMAKITSAQSRKDGISSREISIGMKMVASYNETVKGLMRTSRAYNSKQNNQTVLVRVEKIVKERGIDVMVETEALSASRATSNIQRTQIVDWGWWGFKIAFTNDVINKMTWGSVGLSLGALAIFLKGIPAVAAVCSILGPAGWVICGAGALVFIGNVYFLRQANIACGQRGAYLKFEWWPFGFSVWRTC